ncbi:MAG: fumarylacetoacetate hydrolase family protein [Acidimicrobiaceae bacterium]|nr:fumarylacetoacetate hydrolase family protein [Acidimicrobiaceae bacterium]
MRLATIRVPEGTRAVSIEGSQAVELGYSDVGSLLSNPSWESELNRSEVVHNLEGLDYSTLIPSPSKIICVGHNYRNHIKEMGREFPTHPTLFAKFAEALIGANDEIYLSPESPMYDWEGELGVVVGKTVRSCSEKEARDCIAGFTVINDVTARDWQYRTLQWLQGKTFEGSTPVGPHLVKMDVDQVIEEGLDLSCEVNGEQVQHTTTSDLLFDPAFLVSYISKILTLRPGDVIATGTPGGVGYARDPQRFLKDGDILVTKIEGIGELRNICKSA